MYYFSSFGNLCHLAVYIQSGDKDILTKTKIHEAVKKSLDTPYHRQLDRTNCERDDQAPVKNYLRF